MNPCLLLFVAIFICPAANSPQKARILSCYFQLNDPPLSAIDPDLCTHLILIGSCSLNSDGELIVPPVIASRQVAKFQAKTKSAPKILVSFTPNNAIMSQVVSTRRSQFVKNITNFLLKNPYDGFDIDWEFPVWGTDAHPEDRQNFNRLLKELRSAFNNSDKPLLLTAAVAAPYTIAKIAYDIPILNQYLDFVQIMNYDFHIWSWREPVVAHNAPLYKEKVEFFFLARMNADFSTRFWLNSGMAKEKTVFGLPTYGRGFTLVDRFLHVPYSPADGPSVYGSAYSYPTVCNLTATAGYHEIWDEFAMCAYLLGGDKQWLGLENSRSIAAKTAFARDLEIAGVMVFALFHDDRTGLCGNRTYPLTKLVRQVLFEERNE